MTEKEYNACVKSLRAEFYAKRISLEQAWVALQELNHMVGA